MGGSLSIARLMGYRRTVVKKITHTAIDISQFTYFSCWC